MKNIKATLLTNWSLTRSLRLALGVLIAFQAFHLGVAWMGLVSAFFLFQAATNTGCCASSGCRVKGPDEKQPVEEVVFEEIPLPSGKQ